MKAQSNMPSISMLMTLLSILVFATISSSFVFPKHHSFQSKPKKQQTKYPKSTCIAAADFFDEVFDDTEDEEEEEDVPFPNLQRPAPPSYPDPFATSGKNDNTFSTSASKSSELGSTTLQPPEEDELSEIPTTPMDEFIPKVNIVTLHGRVGQDPNPRYFDDGKVVLNLSLACKRKYHPLERQVREIKGGEEETDWFGLELWGRDAEFATKFVSKGMRVGVTGSLTIDSYKDKMTGEPRSAAKIIVKHLDILETRAESELRRNNAGRPYNPNAYKSNRDRDDDDDGYSNAPAGSGGFFD